MQTPRVKQIESIFDVPPSKSSVNEWQVDLPIEDEKWNVGMIVGPSGCGKSSVLEKVFPNCMVQYDWPEKKSVVDAFPESMSIKDISKILNSVGFSSPPSCLRPYHMLSNGEQFRVKVARAIAETEGIIAIDEFTSVVDRTVAKIGSAAIAKAIRKANRQLVVASCHYDIIDWLQPDWLYEPAVNSCKRRRLRKRPDFDFTICKVQSEAWQIFSKHHYLTSDIHSGAHLFMAEHDAEPIGILATIYQPSRSRTENRIWFSRIVVLPDYQGIGLAGVLLRTMASLYKALGFTMCGRTAARPLVEWFARQRDFRVIDKYRSFNVKWNKEVQSGSTLYHQRRGKAIIGRSKDRPTVGVRYVGPPGDVETALSLILPKVLKGR